MDNYTISEINNIADNQALVYHRECVLLGINKDIQIKWGYSNDGFQRMIKSLRIYMRCDLGIINYCGENKTIISNLKSILENLLKEINHMAASSLFLHLVTKVSI